MSRETTSQALGEVRSYLLSIRELYCYFLQSFFSCVDRFYRRMEAFLCPAAAGSEGGRSDGN